MKTNSIRRLAAMTLAHLQDLQACRRGATAIEFALFAPILLAILANVVDIGRLITTQMTVQNAAEMGVQRALKNCMGQTSPVTVNCSNLAADITTAVQSTWLGTGITLSAGPTSMFYCMSGTSLQSVGGPDSPPSPDNCSAVGNATARPGEYVELIAQTTFTKLFPFSFVPSPKVTSAKAMMRVN